jgi:hypothetical protein
MHQYYYDLQIYEDLICGDLEPGRLNGEKIQIGINYLEQDFGTCQNMKILKLKYKKDNLQVLEKLNITNAHPLARKYFSEQDLAFDNDVEELLSKEIVALLNVNLDKVRFTITKAKNSIHEVGICENSSWNEIDQNRVKYCYYYQVLKEYQSKIKRAFHEASFELNESDFRKLINAAQKSLMYYIKELNKQHDVNPDLLEYKVKESYTNQDCFSLMYISLIELLNFLYENHHDVFDKTYPVPYYSEKINVNQIEEKIKTVKTHLKRHKIDPLLFDVLEEQFQRVLQFDHPKRLTYHELDYFIELLNSFSRYLITFQRENITTDDIISLLISFKFNNYKFTQYVTNEFRKDIATINENREKLLYLLERQKMVKQSIEAMAIQCEPNSTDISEVICNWINYEKKVIKAIMETPKDIQETAPEAYKIETTLSAKQLAVFIKMLSDCDVIVSNSQFDIARWISAVFRTNNTENISPLQLRKNLYNSDPEILVKIKDVGISLVNGCNENLNNNG